MHKAVDKYKNRHQKRIGNQIGEQFQWVDILKANITIFGQNICYVWTPPLILILLAIIVLISYRALESLLFNR